MPRDLLMEALHQARLADSCFADDQRHLPFTIEHPLPTIQHQAQFNLAPDEWRQSTRCRFEKGSRICC